MSAVEFSVRHVQTLSALPETLMQGRAYFVDDEGSIIINHGNGAVTYGGRKLAQENAAAIGTLEGLRTSNRDDIVSAINEAVETSEVLTLDGMYPHLTYIRGKNLGDTFTSEQSAHIRDGTFKDLYLGDYWEMTRSYADGDNTYTETMKWVIVDIDYFYGLSRYANGAWTVISTHHVVVMPTKSLYSCPAISATPTTLSKPETGPVPIQTGGYFNRWLRITGLNRAKAFIKACFGADHLMPHCRFMCSAMAYDSDTSLREWRKPGGIITAIKADMNTTVELPAGEFIIPVSYNPPILKLPDWGTMSWPFYEAYAHGTFQLFTQNGHAHLMELNGDGKIQGTWITSPHEGSGFWGSVSFGNSMSGNYEHATSEVMPYFALY